MPYMRIYEITAKAGQEQAMRQALAGLSRTVAALEGCRDVEIAIDEKAGSRFRFVERWADRSAWEQSAASLPKGAFAPIMAAASEPPATFAGLDLLLDDALSH